MAFGEKARQYILRNVRELGIGCGIGMILMGVYTLIIVSNAAGGYILHPGMGYILMGISFITMNLLELDWKPLLMLTCAVVALGLAFWILLSPEMRPLNVRRLCNRRLWRKGQSPMRR